jgi:hypothetical protein
VTINIICQRWFKYSCCRRSYPSSLRYVKELRESGHEAAVSRQCVCPYLMVRGSTLEVRRGRLELGVAIAAMICIELDEMFIELE